MKLSELVTEENMGKVKVRLAHWHRDEFFVPFFKNKRGTWFGLDFDGDDQDYDDYTDWELYTEPPKTKKVVLYQYWHKDSSLSAHLTKEQFDALGSHQHLWTKIESTRLEIEVPDER